MEPQADWPTPNETLKLLSDFINQKRENAKLYLGSITGFAITLLLTGVFLIRDNVSESNSRDYIAVLFYMAPMAFWYFGGVHTKLEMLNNFETDITLIMTQDPFNYKKAIGYYKSISKLTKPFWRKYIAFVGTILAVNIFQLNVNNNFALDLLFFNIVVFTIVGVIYDNLLTSREFMENLDKTSVNQSMMRKPRNK